MKERERISFSFPFSFSPRAFDFVCASVSLFCSFPPIPDPMAIVEYHVEERQHRRRLGACVTSRPYQSTFNSFSSPIEKGKNRPQRPPSFIAKAFSESTAVSMPRNSLHERFLASFPPLFPVTSSDAQTTFCATLLPTVRSNSSGYTYKVDRRGSL